MSNNNPHNSNAAAARFRRPVQPRHLHLLRSASLAISLIFVLNACGPNFREEQELATATATAVPTATPAPVLEPIELRDALRAAAERAPAPEAAAPCGKVDLLDFPMGPPEGIDYGPRWPFGRFSRRYNKIHAGEDWAYAYGSSLGRPVHAIGHGLITYAQPLGWGGDKGVVIVRHAFNDGSTKLSFYGHLDENSVTLKAGSCVNRGEQLGLVGDPRTRPHLHFEIRDHMPNAPGPGYWATDPALAGWEPPSEFIYTRRAIESPGVRWTRDLTSTRRIFVGTFAQGKLGLFDEGRATVFDAVLGQELWSVNLGGERASSAVADQARERIYWADSKGRVSAAEAGEIIWQSQLSSQAVSLFARPGGGLMVYADQGLSGLNSDGQVDWRRFEDIEDIASWSSDQQGMVFSTQLGARSRAAAAGSGANAPSVYALSPAGALRPICAQAGQVAISGSRVFVYRAEGVYACDRDRGKTGAGTPDSASPVGAELVMGLEGAAVGPGSILALPDGKIAISHRGALGARIIMLEPEGAIRWQHKTESLVQRAMPPSLHLHAGRLYAMTRLGDLFEVDHEQPRVTRVFSAGQGQRLAGDAALLGSTGDSALLLDYRGGRLIALDPPRAQGQLDAAGD